MSTPHTIKIGSETLGPRFSPIRILTPEGRSIRQTFPSLAGATVYQLPPTTRILESDFSTPSTAVYATYALAVTTIDYLQTLAFNKIRGSLTAYDPAARIYGRCRVMEFNVTNGPFYDPRAGGWKFNGTIRFEQFAQQPTS